jgi:hypothetical protein
MKSQLSEFFQQYGRLSVEFYGKGEITYEKSQKYPCNFGVIQLSNGKTYFAVDTNGTGTFTLKELDTKFNFRGITESGSIVTVQTRDVQFLIHESISSNIILVYLIRCFRVETDSKKPIKRIHFGLTNFLFTGNNIPRDDLSLNLRDLPSIFIQRLPNYNEVTNRLNDKTSVEVTSELVIPLNNAEKIENIINISNEICFLLSICRGSKIFWIYYTCYDEQGSFVYQHYCNLITRPLSDLPELIISELPGVKSTKTFLEVAHITVSENSLLTKYLPKFSNVFVEARDGKGYLESRGVKIVVLMEMLVKYVLENPYFGIKEYILDPSTQKDTKKDIIDNCKEVINTQIRDLDDIRSSSRWNLPTADALNIQIRVFDSRLDLINNLSSINRTPFRRLIVKLCEKINLEINETEIKRFVHSRNALIHTGKYYSDPLVDKAVFEEYAFLVNFLDKVFLKLFNYSGEYNNFRKWGSSLEDNI